MNSISEGEYLASCCDIAHQAGKLIMRYFAGGFATQQKSDESPVTDADIAANRYITEALAKLAPHIPIIAEEDQELGSAAHETFWLVDPLDGTRSFIKGEPEFTVNIGLIKNRRPVLGVIYAPPQQALYYAAAGQGAFRLLEGGAPEAIRARAPEADGLVVVSSKSHKSPRINDYLQSVPIKLLIAGSSSIKFCTLAEGGADRYPRFGRTMEWDTAAGHAILNEAGGRVETADGQPLLYGKPGFENPHFIAYGL